MGGGVQVVTYVGYCTVVLTSVHIARLSMLVENWAVTNLKKLLLELSKLLMVRVQSDVLSLA